MLDMPLFHLRKKTVPKCICMKKIIYNFDVRNTHMK